MRRSLVTALVAGFGVLSLTGGSVADADARAEGTADSTAHSDDDRSRRGRTLEFAVQFSDFFMLDFGPTGVREVRSFQDPFDPSRGDEIVFEDVLLDDDGDVVGEGGGTCVVTDLRETAPLLRLACDATYELRGGQVVAQGRTTNDAVKTLAIVGGTGRYVGASGELELTENGDGTGSLVLRLARR
jgi:hypothetical protein